MTDAAPSAPLNTAQSAAVERSASPVLLGSMASPPGAVSAGQDTPITAEAEQARTEIETLKGDKDFIKAYTSGSVQARERMSELHQAAYPETAGDDAPMPTTPAGQAQAEIEARRGDSNFIRRIEEGDTAARAELDALHAAAHPELLPLAFDESTPIATVAKAQELAQGTADSLGIAPEFARGSVATLERAVSARLDDNGQPRAMDALELSRMEFLLQERLGDNYDSAMDNVEGALKRAGKGGAWLQRTILAAGPAAAVWAFQTLAGLQGGEQ